MHEVYAYGVIAPSTLVELEEGFPPTAGYAEIAGVHPSIGGEAAGSAYVLSRLGITTKLSGSRLGVDSDSQRVIDLLSDAGVDCTSVATDASGPVTEIVFSAEGERTIFGTYGQMLADGAWSQPSLDDIAASDAVCLDPFFGAASDQAASWCRDTGTPYVTIDTPPDSLVARHAAAVIISEEYAVRTRQPADPHAVHVAYTEASDGLIIVTQGSRAGLYGRRGTQTQEFSPFPVGVRDTAGAGDSFRAGIVYGLLRGYDDSRTVRTAAAVAAMVCECLPGVLGSPTESELTEFLRAHA